VLLWPDAAMLGLNFNAGEHCQLLADHIGCDGDGAPTDEISGATCKAELNGPAGTWIRQLAHLIAKQSQIGACAEC